MTPRERVAAALACRVPDRVPYCELWIDPEVAARLLALPREAVADQLTPQEAHRLADTLGLDNLIYVLRPPVYARLAEGKDHRQFVGAGLVKSWDDLDQIELPPLDDLLAPAQEFAAGKAHRAVFLVTRAGLFPTIHSMGFETFCVALGENRDLVEAIFDRYAAWAAALAAQAADLGFDAFVTTDDFAFKTGMFFSPRVFRELVVPRYERIARELTIPWILHSDGDISAALDDLVELGVAAIHPLEKGAMDILAVKRRYGGRLCLVGNVQMDLLARGSPGEVEREVRWLLANIAPGGGYILASGNSLANYLSTENILAMSRAARELGNYPITENQE